MYSINLKNIVTVIVTIGWVCLLHGKFINFGCSLAYIFLFSAATHCGNSGCYPLVYEAVDWTKVKRKPRDWVHERERGRCERRRPRGHYTLQLLITITNPTRFVVWKNEHTFVICITKLISLVDIAVMFLFCL